MPTITDITQQRRRPDRRSVFIDGEFAFGCHVNVVARFRLQTDMPINADLRRQIELGEVKQEAFDHALRLVGGRRQSERELRQKLGRKEYGQAVVDAVVADCERLGYLDDAAYASARASDAANLKLHGRQRAVSELVAKGIDRSTAESAADEAYAEVDPVEMATKLANKRLPSLQRLDRPAAQRRLSGFLQRRGFDFDTVRTVVERVLGDR
ncbi:MAG: RecX family transcriptional regulator [Planctomycetota bacterium]